VLPCLYLANSEEVAVAECVLHDVGFGEPHPIVLAARLANLALTELDLDHGLSLIDLTGLGLRRLRAEPQVMLYSGPASYPTTAAFAEILLRATRWADGFLYPSRQFPAGQCAVVYQRRGRVVPSLRIRKTMALGAGPGRVLVDRISASADVTVVV
jgi:hypothetical protein